MRGAAGNFKRVSLELGGKSANVIFDDADLDAASKAAAAGIFFNAGQVCSAGSRVLVQEKVYDEVVERLTARAKALRIGDPGDRATVLGPVISEKQMKSILGYVDIGQKEGALLTTGGRRVGDRGYFVSPAVFANVEHEMRISQEEIFGPVVSVIRFRDEADALRIANGTAYSLAAGRLEPRHGTRTAFHEKGEGRNGMDQHLRLYRRTTTLGGRARLRPRPGTRHRGDR